MMAHVLRIDGLTIGYRDEQSRVALAVHDVDLQIQPGRITGLVGESGSGKSTTALAAIGFLAPGAVRVAGTAEFEAADLLADDGLAARRSWGRGVAYVAQDATRSLDPTQRIGAAFRETMARHRPASDEQMTATACELLAAVGIPAPEDALRRYPHQFSGGQQQRIALALALALEPQVVVLDEPTTGLDVTTQAQIVALIVDLVRSRNLAALAISHDLALLATMCDDLAVMYAGEIVERADALTIFHAPRHPYAAGLVDATPRIDNSARPVGIPGRPPPATLVDACSFAARCRYATSICSQQTPAPLVVAADHVVRCHHAETLESVHAVAIAPSAMQPSLDLSPVLDVRDVSCGYGSTTVVDHVSLQAFPGEMLCIVGESGSGKSTLLRAIAGLHRPSGGSVHVDGNALAASVSHRTSDQRRDVQLVFQNPDASLNPRHTIGRLIDRPLRLFFPELRAGQRAERVAELLDAVRLDPSHAGRRPHELSGGQRQRVALARAFAARPRLLLCDEVVSALDVSVQAVVLDLLTELASVEGATVVFVTHDLGVVRAIAHRVVVMQSGVVRETGLANDVFGRPQHTYTRQLLAAIPTPRPLPIKEETR